MSRELAEHGYYKQKGVVSKLASKYVAQVSMLGSGDLLQVRRLAGAFCWVCILSRPLLWRSSGWWPRCVAHASMLCRNEPRRLAGVFC